MSAETERFILRDATEHDAEWLLALANDPTVRRVSFSPNQIEMASHMDWLTARLASPSCRIWVAEEQGSPLGVIRYERDQQGVAEVHLAVIASHRGKGIGAAMLCVSWEPACKELEVSRVRGLIRAENAASVRAFEKAGYIAIGTTERCGQPCRIFERVSGTP